MQHSSKATLIPPNGQFARGSAPAWPHEDRKHRQTPGIEVDDALTIAEQVDV